MNIYAGKWMGNDHLRWKIDGNGWKMIIYQKHLRGKWVENDWKMIIYQKHFSGPGKCFPGLENRWGMVI